MAQILGRGGVICCATDSVMPAVIFIVRFMSLCPLCLSSVTNLLLSRHFFGQCLWGDFNVKSIFVFQEMTKLNKCHQEMPKPALFSLVKNVPSKLNTKLFLKTTTIILVISSILIQNETRKSKANPSPYPLAPPEGKYRHVKKNFCKMSVSGV